MIEQMMEQLMEDCEHLLTHEQREAIREAIVLYAMAALHDSDIEKEVWEENAKICEKGDVI